DCRRSAELFAAATLGRAARRHDRAMARFPEQEDRRRADAATPAVHECGLPRREVSEARHEEVRERRQEHLREAACLLDRHAVGDGQHGTLVDDRLLGVAAPREQRHDALPRGEAANVGADLAHLPGAFEERVGEIRSLGRCVDDMRAGLERGLGVTRAHLAAVAAGEARERAAILRGSPYQDIKPTDAFGLWERTPGLFVLDVRTSGEFANGHIPNAHLVPVDELEDRLGELPPPDTTMLVTCAAGGRSTAACQLLGEKGYVRLLNLSGGMHTWPGPQVREATAPPSAPPAPAGTTVSFRGGPVTE